jgi:hypothetical protein
MLENIKVCGEDIGGKVVLSITSGKFEGCNFYYDGLRFAEKENEDGSMNMSFDYEITNGFDVQAEAVEELQTLLGDNLLCLVEDSVKMGSTVFTGGT